MAPNTRSTSSPPARYDLLFETNQTDAALLGHRHRGGNSARERLSRSRQTTATV
jgi:hypothetical protein